MISVLISKVMKECSLKQKDLAVVLDVPLQRVKRLTGGEVQKFTPEETRRMVQTLNLSAHWLATGEGPMFNPQGGQQMGEILTQMRLTAARLEELGVRGDAASALMEIANALAFGDATAVLASLQGALAAALAADESVLLNSYRKCNSESKATLVQTAALLSAGLQSPKRRASSAGVSQDNTGAGAVQIGGDATGAAINTGSTSTSENIAVKSKGGLLKATVGKISINRS